jgi:hypothetical protein
MQGGDLASWNERRVAVVLEGILAKVPPATVSGRKFLRRGWVGPTPSPDTWEWSGHAIRLINDKAFRLNIPIDIVTFTSQEVADSCADWVYRYDIRVASCEFYDFGWFCKSILWRPDLHVVVDSDSSRLEHYGVKAFQSFWGGDF